MPYKLNPFTGSLDFYSTANATSSQRSSLIIQPNSLVRETDTGLLWGGDGKTTGGLPIRSPYFDRREVSVGMGTDLNAFTVSNGTTELSGTSFCKITIPYGCTGPRILFTNFEAPENGTGTLYPVTISQVTASANGIGAPYLGVTFNGQQSVTLAPGGFILSDPIGCDVAPGAQLAVYIYITVSSGNTYTKNYIAQASKGEGNNYPTNGSGAGTNITTSAGTPTTFNGAQFGPAAIIGRPYITGPNFLLVGDSIDLGVGDTYYLGFNYRAMTTLGLPFVRCAQAGQQTQNWIKNSNRKYSTAVLPLLGTTDCIWEYGTNDVTIGGRTLAQIKADTLTGWSLYQNTGHRMWANDWMPKTTSTNNWTDLAGQTPQAGFEVGGIRDQYRAFLLTLPQSLAGVIPSGSMMDAPTAPGKWPVGYVYTSDGTGTHPNATGHIFAASQYTGFVAPW